MNMIMGTPDLTVRVLNLSPRVTHQELITFFSYCGTVHQLQLLRDKDQLPYALVTFVQPYAFQTALLLDDVIFAGQPICILPLCDIRIPIVSDDDIDDHAQSQEFQTKRQGFIPAANILKQRKEDLEEKLKMSEKGRVLMEQTKSAIYAVEQAAGRVGTAISTGASRLSDVFDKASRSAPELGIRKRPS